MLRSSSPHASFADDLDDLMRASSPSPGSSSDSDELPAAIAPTGAQTNPAAADTSVPSSVGPIRNELAYARHLARHHKLNATQHVFLDELAHGQQLVRDIINFVQMCRVENRLDDIVVATPPYEVSSELAENIKSVVIAVLLSPRLQAYKGDAPKDGVLTILLEKKLHFPKEYTDDISVQNTIEAAIREELIQTRSKLKKAIKEGIDKEQRLYDMAIKLVKDTKCSVTVPLCGKLALLRNLFFKDAGPKYWDRVDRYLHEIRQRADGDQIKIATVFKNLIKKDMDKFGSNNSDKIAEDLNHFQQNIEDSLDLLDN